MVSKKHPNRPRYFSPMTPRLLAALLLATALAAAGRLTFTTQLTNPLGTVDQVPANNRRASVLTPPKK